MAGTGNVGLTRKALVISRNPLKAEIKLRESEPYLQHMETARATDWSNCLVFSRDRTVFWGLCMMAAIPRKGNQDALAGIFTPERISEEDAGAAGFA